MKDWEYNKNGTGCAGEYIKNGWRVWCNNSGWKTTRPDGFTYAVEYKEMKYAFKFAEGKMNRC